MPARGYGRRDVFIITIYTSTSPRGSVRSVALGDGLLNHNDMGGVASGLRGLSDAVPSG